MGLLLNSVRRVVVKTLERIGVLPLRGEGDYLQRRFMIAIGRRRVQTIFEFGSRDGEDTLRLRDRFGAFVHTFECNPLVLPSVRERLHGEPGVRLVERAVWDADGPIPFYPVVHTTQHGEVLDNPGASSCFRIVTGYHQSYVQTEVMVEAIRLDTYCRQEGLEGPDMLCIDVQGAALQALRGLGSYLDRVRVIIIELEDRELFAGEDLFPVVDQFLKAAGFRLAVTLPHDGWFQNHLYLKRRRFGW